MRATDLKMGRYIRVLFLVTAAFILSAVTAFSFSMELSRSEREYLEKKGEIVFVSQSQYPPFEFAGDNGEMEGMCIDLIRWMAEQAGFRPRFLHMPFQAAQEAVLTGRADVLTSFFYSSARDKYFDFTRVVFEVPASIFVPADRPDILGLDDLRGKKIAMQKGDYAGEFLEAERIDFTPVYTDNFADAADLVIAAEADAVIGDEQIVLYHLYKNDLSDRLKIIGDPLYVGRDCMAVGEGNKKLVDILNRGINSAISSGRLAEIEKEWSGHPLGAAALLRGDFFHALLIVAAAVVLAVGIFWFWNMRLRSLVRFQTAELRKSENRFRKIFQSFPDVYFETSTEGEIITISPSITRLAAFSPRDLIGKNVTRYYVNPRVREKFVAELKGKGHVDDIEAELKDSAGQTVPCSISAVLLKDLDSGRPVIAGAIRDIRDRKEMEAQLVYLSGAVESLGEMVIVTDLEHRITYANPAVERLLGYKPEEMIGHPSAEFFEGIEGNPPDLKKYIARHSGKDAWRGEVHNRKKDGSIITVLLTLNWLRDARGEIIGSVGVSMDITEHEKLEEQLRHAQKMEAVGTLAGGIAHDFNNILAGALGYISLVKESLPEEGEVRPDIEAVERLLWRGSSLTRSLLTFSRKGKYRPEAIDLNACVEEVMGIIRQIADKKIEVKKELTSDIPLVWADPGQIHQVIMNLCINACEAMPDGGVLTVSTGRPGPGLKHFTVDQQIKKRNFVTVAVSDNGVGISPEYRERIYEPFFTTKEDKTGTGLGLSVVKGIVEQHGGWVDMESGREGGSRFTVYLPATSRIQSARSPSPVPAGQKEAVILIIDDEPDFRDATARWLENFSYRVLTAATGREAIRLVKEEGDDIDLAVLDMIMPVMGGEEIFEEIQAIRPDIPVIICTGCAIEDAALRLLDRGAADYLQKPFKFQTLSEKIQQILSGRRR